MSLKTIVIGSDHRGVPLKFYLRQNLKESGYDVIDVGAESQDISVDYPDYAEKACEKIENGEAEFGVLICGTGVGMSIAANRNPNIRAALCNTRQTTILSRQHNNANVIVFGADAIDKEGATALLKLFVETEFEGGRHCERVQKLD